MGVSTLFVLKAEKHRTAFSISWFLYTGTSFTAASYNNSWNYINMGGEASDCAGTTVLCAIQAQSDSPGGKPILFPGFGTKVIAKEGTNTSTSVTSATTTITVQYMLLD